MRPLIGITTATFVNPEGWEYNRVYAPNVRAITRSGGIPVLIPTGLDEGMLRELYGRLDGILLPGGVDVDPVHYNAAPHQTTKVDNARDAVELMLTRWAVADDRPLLGICRGHQVVNVALGGTLVQDIPSELNTSIPHDQPNDQPRSQRLHEVKIASASHLASVLGCTQALVNSLHHQAVGQVAPGMQVTASAPDGVVEALEVSDRRFLLSVQWHPEDLYESEEAMRRLFDAFIEAARVQS